MSRSTDFPDHLPWLDQTAQITPSIVLVCSEQIGQMVGSFQLFFTMWCTCYGPASIRLSVTRNCWRHHHAVLTHFSATR